MFNGKQKGVKGGETLPNIVRLGSKLKTKIPYQVKMSCGCVADWDKLGMGINLCPKHRRECPESMPKIESYIQEILESNLQVIERSKQRLSKVRER